ncbi:Putative uncharacterized protein [Moritella viscosa]|uniref:DUF2787 family protein n=1 Tax=Moritella viscosa TaxID=80854 RepID=UPI0005090F59|nr:DUF2787 family protein [Moritella viscosa]CED61887.1 putative uncharacterized protein [Moritella viscosa]SHO07413.1 Putative uncharacterized protein [Moritella viscosa]SHO21896.1 Putative uncharacterized protein [Moritella viscosa]
MKLNFDSDNLLVPVTPTLMDLLAKVAQEQDISNDAKTIVFNFRDSTYSNDSGGYHPVEISITCYNGLWQFDYITSFSYQGYPYPELAKEIDFDMRNGTGMVYPLPMRSLHEVMDFYPTWEMNFIAYQDSGAFDEVKLSTF